METLDVWLVEDNAVYRQTVCEMLDAQADIICSEAFSTVDALLAALNTGACPDLILMDVQLPGIDGVEGVQHVKQIAPATDVLMLTVQEDDDTIFRAIQAGASGYLLKMASLDRILHAIRTTHRGGAIMTPQIARRVLALFNHLTTPEHDYHLTPRERDVLGELVHGGTKAQIAESLFVSEHTVDTHLRNIYGKLHVHSRTEAVAKALKERLL